MALIEHKILSKVLDENNFYALNKHNVNEVDFQSIPEVYNFIKKYTKEYGQVPEYTTVVEEFEDFEYQEDTADNIKYLSNKIKQTTGKREAFELLQKQAGKKYKELDGQAFTEWLYRESERIKNLVSSESYSGENFATSGTERWKMYQNNKEERSFKFISTPYPSLTRALGGGLELGDYVLLQAYTNRGKSWIASQIGVNAWISGNGVLHYSPELSYEQQSQRNDTLLGHFDNMKLKVGDLNNEEQYKEYLEGFSESNETPYIIKTMEHLPEGLSTDVIEADLQANPDVKMVIIDGFNLMAHAGKDGNRNNMSNTSRKLRQSFARHQVVGLVVHQTPTQAEKVNHSDMDEERVVAPPKISDYSETIAVIQDASTVLNYDAMDGMGKILIAKARANCVNQEIDLHTDYNNGYITERTIIDDI